MGLWFLRLFLLNLRSYYKPLTCFLIKGLDLYICLQSVISSDFKSENSYQEKSHRFASIVTTCTICNYHEEGNVSLPLTLISFGSWSNCYKWNFDGNKHKFKQSFRGVGLVHNVPEQVVELSGTDYLFDDDLIN